MAKTPFSRRDFIKTASLSLGGTVFASFKKTLSASGSLVALDFPNGERLGRVLDGQVEIKAKPDDSSPTLAVRYSDEVVVWLREVAGSRPLWFNQRYVETPEGYIYSPNLQPVRNQPNLPLRELPASGGFWAEVTVPYVDLLLANPPARSPWLEYTQTPRLYYSQIMWVDEIKAEEQGQVLYRVSERYGSFGDIFWVPGEALRALTGEEMSPIHPDIEDKRVVVDVSYQTLSCFEGNSEVYFCRVSTGGKYDSSGNAAGEWATPLGNHTIWRKMISVHMTGGTTGGGYDLPGIGWTTLFSGQGMAIHSTFWHNSFGVPKSHGCVNASPEDAKWVFRWTHPFTPAEPGDVTISGKGSSKVLVLER